METREFRRPLAVGLSLATVVIFGVWLAIDALFGSLCENTVMQTVISPDAAHQAVLFARNCGATTDFSTQLSIIKTGSEPSNGLGNVFIAERGPRGNAAPSAEPLAEVHWTRPDSLTIVHDPGARVSKAATSHGDIRIDIQPAH